MDLRSKRVVVVGLGASGIAAALHLAKDHGARVLGSDVKAPADDAAQTLSAAGVELRVGPQDDALFGGTALVVVSPGVPTLAAIDRARARGVPVASEIELASWSIAAPIVAITGTNGKSTVTSLVGAMASFDARPVFVGGNLGTPMTAVVRTPSAGADGLCVVELSSFQLERVERFRPRVAVLLNITEDHLDRYPSFAGYAAAKGRIFHAQGSSDHAVVPAGDEVCLALARAGAAKVHRYGGDDGEVREEGGVLVDVESGLRFPAGELRIHGRHNVSNACAAILAARLAGVSLVSIERGLRTFEGLPHRMVRAGEIDGVVFLDDSKATNVGAAVAALDGLDDGRGRVVLIAGGRDKGGSYASLRERLERVGRALVTIGEAAPLIETAFTGTPLPVVRATTMDDAVAKGRELAKRGDRVLLAPACSSYDMFGSYAERGDVFRRAVESLGGAR